MKVVNSVRQGDVIESIAVEGDTSELFAQVGDKIREWYNAQRS